MCQNYNDVKAIDECIKEIWKCVSKGKQVYISCANFVKYVEDVSQSIKEVEEKIKKLANEFAKTEENVIDMDKVVSKVFYVTSVLEKEKGCSFENVFFIVNLKLT